MVLLILCVGLQVCKVGFRVVGAKYPGEIYPLFKGILVMVRGNGALVPDAWACRIARSVGGVVQDVVGVCDAIRKVHFRTGLCVLLKYLFLGRSAGRTAILVRRLMRASNT